MANLFANVCHVSQPAALAECLAMVTSRAVAILRATDYGIAPGNPADLVLLDAADPALKAEHLRRIQALRAAADRERR
jgi:cytosine deaminase